MGRDWKAELWGRFGFRESQSAAGTEVLLPDGLKAAEITRSVAPFKSVKAVKKKLNKKKKKKTARENKWSRQLKETVASFSSRLGHGMSHLGNRIAARFAWILILVMEDNGRQRWCGETNKLSQQCSIPTRVKMIRRRAAARFLQIYCATLQFEVVETYKSIRSAEGTFTHDCYYLMLLL